MSHKIIVHVTSRDGSRHTIVELEPRRSWLRDWLSPYTWLELATIAWFIVVVATLAAIIATL